MITQVTRDHVSEIEPGQFATEASTLCLFPGEVWPTFINTSLGNGQRLLLIASDDERARYRQEHGCIDLVVFND